ncbi:hypothetical protein ACP_2698 [Acidobacterium capsulatum ATCC 51196]|uniref:Uncharacterized protein n=1 Tax=Acidobacterium capsulatum (strain ATCC 51196 / DSM 11244 / BCRC 80197 / JCM 7670 / NBRC 15755 / NCIMB 13165 / 161) TaxID=240015 RepID=C1F2N9_ACIC5|nr:hypothetical protein ACP_2698 [Acidobacterium capsulatum ATCC 51196]
MPRVSPRPGQEPLNHQPIPRPVQHQRQQLQQRNHSAINQHIHNLRAAPHCRPRPKIDQHQPDRSLHHAAHAQAPPQSLVMFQMPRQAQLSERKQKCLRSRRQRHLRQTGIARPRQIDPQKNRHQPQHSIRHQFAPVPGLKLQRDRRRNDAHREKQRSRHRHNHQRANSFHARMRQHRPQVQPKAGKRRQQHHQDAQHKPMQSPLRSHSASRMARAQAPQAVTAITSRRQ